MGDAGSVSELRAEGFAVLPAPRKVTLTGGRLRLDGALKFCFSGVEPGDIAVRTLQTALHELQLAVSTAARQALCLKIEPGCVSTGCDDARDSQAYRLAISDDGIEITGNASAGLFYGAQTLIQLLESRRGRTVELPLGVIEDWPALELRIVHWDSKHHQDRLETLRRFLDEMARFKLNAVAFELEDKFAYPSHPVIGAPTAFTTAELQELVRYGLERHIQIIPDVQAPAHMSYVLKHPQFAHLRCDGSNYQICMEDPAAQKLIFEMYADLCEATPGVEYFLVSTDEVYYPGICERFRKPYSPENRSLIWVEFVRRAQAFLKARGRRAIIWAESPLRAEHIQLLPPEIIDGVVGGDEKFLEAEKALGLRQLAYASMQGEELLFPNHFAYTDSKGRQHHGRLEDALETVAHGKASRGNPLGTFAAAWDDSGLHNETFWLGWAVMAQAAWSPGRTSLEQSVADFMDVFHGTGSVGMPEVYRELQRGARFYEESWARRPSKVRGPAYGSSNSKRPVTRTDLTLTPPALPRLPDLTTGAVFAPQCAEFLRALPERFAAAEALIARLNENLTRVSRNRHNLEVFLTLAYFQRQHLRLLRDLARAEEILSEAAPLHRAGKRAEALSAMRRAHRLVSETAAGLRETFAQLQSVWEKGRLPKNADLNGREFLYVMDDVKDHVADRRRDLSYLIAPEESMELGAWCDTLATLMRQYETEE